MDSRPRPAPPRLDPRSRAAVAAGARALSVLEAAGQLEDLEHAAALAEDGAAGRTPPGARRPLFEHERRSGVNLAAVEEQEGLRATRVAQRFGGDREWLGGKVDDLLAEAPDEAGLRAVVDRLTDAERPLEVDLGDAYLERVAGTEATVRAELLGALQDGAAQVADEAAAQGVVVDVGRPLPGDLLTDLASTARRVAGAPYSTGIDALRATATRAPVLSRGDLVQGVVEGGRAGLEADYARAPVTQAARRGRVYAAEQAPRASRIYASELLDGNTCPPCSLVDGREYGDLLAARADYPTGTYRDCEGGTRCRGTLVFVWDTEAPPTVDAPGDAPPPPFPPPGTPLPETPTPGGPAPAPAQAPTGAAPSPQGIPVSRAIRTQGLRPQVQAAVDDGLAAIDSVHGDGSLPVIPLYGAKIGRSQGEFRSFGATAVDMRIRVTGGETPAFTVVHETGHFLDHRALGRTPGMFGSEDAAAGRPAHPAWQAWREAVNGSQAIQAIRTGPDAYRAYRRYLLSPREEFARSYSQWVAVRSGNRRLLDDLAKLRAEPGVLPYQWADDDFEPIARALDDLFAEVGWRA